MTLPVRSGRAAALDPGQLDSLIAQVPGTVVHHTLGDLATHLLAREHVRDSQSGMWVFRRSILRDMVLESDSMAFSEEIKIEALLEACQLQGRVYPNYALALAARARIAFDDAERLAVANFVRGSRQQAQQMFVEIAAAVVAARSPQGRPQ